ncbi:MAG TPA: helical backbone metal receptor [Polyangia bacterium]|nr:helical backbone metal receptor [Polyangia bacterium]
MPRFNHSAPSSVKRTGLDSRGRLQQFSPPIRVRPHARASFLAVLAVLAVLALSGRPARAVVAVRDDRGVTVTLPAPPRRIVTLLPSLTESVCALGACDRLVGTDRFSNWPASVQGLPKLGGLEDAQIERIVALKPDVVLASISARVMDRLESLGVRVLALESRNRADVKRTLAALGQLLAMPAKAEEVWAGIERDSRAAAARVPAAQRGQRVYFEIDAAPYAAGPSSFIGETLRGLGLDNAIPAELGPFPKLNPEFVVRTQPDIVMAAQATLAEMPRRPGWSTLRALADKRTCAFPNPTYEIIVRPGPRMGEAAAALADCLARLPPPRTR